MTSPRTSVRVAFVLFVFLGGLVAVELVFGRWIAAGPLDRLDIARDTAVTVSSQGLYPDGETFTYRRDRWGFRGAGLDPASVTLLTIGGNTTDQSHLPDGKTWQAVLARELAAMDRNVVVANAGADGMTSVGMIRAMEVWFPNVPGLKPRFVLALVGASDAAGPGGRADRLEGHSMWRRSAFSRLWPAELREGGQGHEGFSPQVAPFKERLKRMADMIHGIGAVPVLVTDVPPAGDKAVATLNGATRDVCRDLGLLCLDLAREVSFAEGDFHHRFSHTPQGAEKVGRWLAGKLAGLV